MKLPMTIRLDCRVAPDYVFVRSDDLPELFLWGPPGQVLPEIGPAVARLLELNSGVDVDAPSTSVTKEGDLFIATCPILDVVSQGRTESEAAANLNEAREAFVESCIARGTMEAVLRIPSA